jgi:L-lactate dehydrogenase complex protein LldG
MARPPPEPDMSDARDTVLGRMRQALGRTSAPGDHETDGDARRAVEARLENPEPTLVPARGDLELEARIALFVEQARDVQSTVERLASFAEMPDTIAGYLRRHNLPMHLTSAVDPCLDGASWDVGLWDLRHGKPNENDPVGLTTAFAGIAETGTLMLASDADHPTTLAFLPETSIVVLSSARIFRAYEDVLGAFRADRDLPRSINLITGPSRSGDIEQTLQLGAHGPKRLFILLVDEPPPGSAADRGGPNSPSSSNT